MRFGGPLHAFFAVVGFISHAMCYLAKVSFSYIFQQHACIKLLQQLEISPWAHRQSFICIYFQEHVCIKLLQQLHISLWAQLGHDHSKWQIMFQGYNLNVYQDHVLGWDLCKLKLCLCFCLNIQDVQPSIAFIRNSRMTKNKS